MFEWGKGSQYILFLRHKLVILQENCMPKDTNEVDAKIMELLMYLLEMVCLIDHTLPSKTSISVNQSTQFFGYS